MTTSAAQEHVQRKCGMTFVEDGETLEHTAWAGGQFIQCIRAPECAAKVKAGCFAHVSCDPLLPVCRPLSIMRVGNDWIETLHKTHGKGLKLLTNKRPGDTVSILGRPFNPGPDKPSCLLIGGSGGAPPMICLADALRDEEGFSLTAILRSEIPLLLEACESTLPFDGSDDEARGSMPLLES